MPRQSSSLLMLSTRPAADGEALARQLNDLPVALVSLPASEPVLLPWQGALEQALAQPADLWFFPSRHAVNVLDYLPQSRRQQITAACPGPGTADALRDRGVRRVVTPDAEHTSEALLAMAELQQVAGQHVLILTAPGGREAMARVLRQRGAHVNTVIVYERRTVSPLTSDLERLRQTPLPWLSVVTSGQGLRHLQHHLTDDLWRRLCAAPMIVPSSRVAEQAVGLGIQQTVCVAPPDNDHIAAYVRAHFDHLIMQSLC